MDLEVPKVRPITGSHPPYTHQGWPEVSENSVSPSGTLDRRTCEVFVPCVFALPFVLILPKG